MVSMAATSPVRVPSGERLQVRRGVAPVAMPRLSSFFLCHDVIMSQSIDDLLTETEKALKKRFEKGEASPPTRVPSTAREPRKTRIDQLLLPDDERGKMPFTKEKYVIRENPQRVQWERELRKFLRKLSPEHEHRIAAVHIYEWATGLRVADLVAEEKRLRDAGELQPGTSQGTWRADLRKLNALLREYFDAPYMTYIMGRKVPNAYRVPKGFYIYRRRPKTLTLYAEWADGVKL